LDLRDRKEAITRMKRFIDLIFTESEGRDDGDVLFLTGPKELKHLLSLTETETTSEKLWV
jgi:hypothetical protein